MFELRPYQREAVEEGLFGWFAKNPEGNPLIAIPTGCGKSLIIAEFIRRAVTLYPGTRILICSHVKELVAQDFEELLELWPSAPCGIYSAGLNRRDTHYPITFVSIASIAKRVSDFGHIDLCIVDEAHMISHRDGTLYHKAFAALKVTNPNLRIIGLSATPFRLGLGMLTEGDIFTEISTDYTSFENFNKLVDEGYIVPLLPRPLTTEFSLENVSIKGGEFVQSELQAACDKESITRAAISEALPWILSENRQHILVFCTGIEHANHTRDILIENGISSICVHSKLQGGDEERDRSIAAFKAGEYRAMVGIGIFGTGFNFRPIDCIIWMRPTLSAVFWVQGNGRGTRPSPETGKVNCRVLDFARNTRNLGPVNDVRIPKKRGKGGGVTPFKICPACGCYNPTRVRFCIECGHEFPEIVMVTSKASGLELIRRTPLPTEPPKPKEPKARPPIQIVTYDVDRVEFSRHKSRDVTKPVSLKISYYCGLRIFYSWLSLEHHLGLPKHKARDMWRLMEGADCDPPDTVEEALERTADLKLPSQIRVEHDGRYDSVIGFEFAESSRVKEMSEDRPF